MKKEIKKEIQYAVFSSDPTSIDKAADKIVYLFERQIDAIYNLHSKPLEQLKPLEDLWRKENPREQFTTPDSTEFYRWIRKKILPE